MPTSIDSPQNPRIKSAAKLRERRGREKQGRIIIDGTREIQAALTNHVDVVELYRCTKNVDDESHRATIALAEQSGATVIEVSPRVFTKLAFGDRTDGFVAVANIPQPSLETWKPTDQPLLAVVQGIEKPGNIGAMIRSADGAGLDALIVVDGGTDLFNPNAIRASIGLIFSLPVFSTTSEEAKVWLAKNKIQMVSAVVDADTNYADVDYKQATAFVLGSESDGLSEDWRGADTTGVRLPMRGRGDSLNVSATAAILFYEAQRQRSAV